MEVVNVNDFSQNNNEKVNMITLYDKQYGNGKSISFGKATFSPGARVPEIGYTKHEGEEFSIIIKGSIDVICGGESMQLECGSSLYVPRDEEHVSINNSDQDCEIIWVLVK